MTKPFQKWPLIYLVGPTASGKTDLAIQLAQHINSEIISADSRYLYRELSIGTAKPSQEERQTVPHHMIDVSSVKYIWSLGEYLKSIESLIADLNKGGKIPIMVGGTGQYYRAIVQGWQVPKLPPNPALRAAIEKWGETIGTERLYQFLSVIDPDAAGNIDYRNTRRTIRAWEVILSTGDLFSNQRQRVESRYNTLTIGIDWDRENLYKRIDLRIEKMFADGMIEEVEALIKSGIKDHVKKIGVIGYSETIAYLEGKISFEEAVTLIKRHTRQFVRRQANWFKPSDPHIHWFKATDPANFEKMLSLIDQYFG